MYIRNIYANIEYSFKWRRRFRFQWLAVWQTADSIENRLKPGNSAELTYISAYNIYADIDNGTKSKYRRIAIQL